MKKTIALLLALLLTIGLVACGLSDEEDTTSTTTTVVGSTASSASATDTTSTVATSVVVGTDTNGSTVTSVVEIRPTTTASTTVFVPSGATVPIGTKPTIVTQTSTTGTTTAGTTTTTTTAPVEDPAGGSSTATTATTTTTTTTTTVTTTTVTTATPSEPEGPYIALPAIGTDIDVVNKKDRIRVSDVAAWMNDDGTIGVSLTFKNYSSNWITEETDYVQYTCYDKNGNVVQRSTKIMIGSIDTKKHVVKTFTFDVPADTAEVRLTGSKIVYWTEWS